MSFDWKRYAESILQEVYDDLSSEFYVSLNLQDSCRVAAAEEILEDFAQTRSYSRLLLTGRPGSGKSFLLNRFAGTLAQQLLDEIELYEFNSIQNNDSSSDYQPDRRTIIPVLVRLNLFNASDYAEQSNSLSIEVKISQHMSQFGLTETLQNFLRSDAQFIFLIDDLDEVSREDVSRNFQEIRRFVERFSAHKYLIAGRESTAQRFEHRFRKFKITNLDGPTAHKLITQAANSDQEILFGILQRAEGLLDFLSTPYFLIQCCDLWNEPNQGDFSIGKALLISLDRLITRQSKTEHAPDVIEILQRRVRVLEKLAFAALLDRDRLSNQELEPIEGEDMIWFEQMEFLRRSPTEVVFSSQWIHAYLATRYLIDLEQFSSPENLRIFLLQKIELMSSTKALVLLLIRDLTDQDYTHLLASGEYESHFSAEDHELYSWMFEKKVEEYIRSQYSFQDVRHSYDPPYLRPNEIDVYAEKHDGVKRIIWVVECKFRFPPYPKSLKKQFLERLINKHTKVCEHRRPRAESEGESVEIVPVLVTNGDIECHPELYKIAEKHRIQMFYVDLTPNKVFARTKITRSERIKVSNQKETHDES